MELIIRLVGFSIVGVIMLTTLGAYGGAGANMQNIGRIIIISVIMLTFIPQITLLFQTITNLAGLATINDVYLGIIMKIIGIAYITEFASSLCADAGESAIAAKVQLAGKVGILMMSLPIINALIDLIQNIMN